MPILMRALLVLLFATPAAAADEGDATRLGEELTPLGAIRAGNEAGTIPAWEGGIQVPPPDYRPGQRHLDPFDDDQPLFTITAGNLDEHAEWLSPGQRAVFERYPETWQMRVFPTRRSASYPERIYQTAIGNAGAARLVDDGNGVADVTGAFPFPVPSNGLEAVWNHLLRYRGISAHRHAAQIAPTAGGDYIEVRMEEQAYWPLFEPDTSVAEIDNLLGYFLQEVKAPPPMAGTVLLVHDTLNQEAEPREAWVYRAGQRRVRRMPNVAYDSPGTGSDGQRTVDQLDMFNGAPDRYTWELVGRRELYVPYNAYALQDESLAHADIIQPGHLNPDPLRYELHRVWQVEARLKEGASHVYARRSFFLDEDSWQILVADHYDAGGQLWRVAEAHTINYYEVPTVWEAVMAIYDLQNGRYLAFGLNNELPAHRFDLGLDDSDFTPDALRRLGRR